MGGSSTSGQDSAAASRPDASQLTCAEIDFACGRVATADNFFAVIGCALAPGENALAGIAARLLERVLPADRAGVEAAFHELLASGGVRHVRFALLDDARRERCIESVWSLERGAGGEPVRAVATGFDSSASRRAEAVLRESEARYGAALTAGRMGSWETDQIRMTRTWSKEGEALFGLSLVDGRGQVGGADDEYEAAMHPEDRHLIQHFHELADRQDSFPAEYRIVRPDGTQLWLAGRGLVVARGPDGKAERLISIMADATDRKHAEERLRIERERLSQALGAGQMGAYDLDMRNNSLWWSPRTYAIFGVSADGFEPTPASAGAMIHPDDREAFIRRRSEAIAERCALMHESRIVRPDGSIVWIGLQGRAEYDEHGKPLRSFGVIMDITERKLVEQALGEADRKKDDFIATLGHELRNPLAPILNAVNLLRRTGGGDPRVVWCGDVIDRQVRQMSRLLDDLLDVSRLTRGQLQLRVAPLQLSTVIEHAVEIAQPVIDAAGHALALTMGSAPLQLKGDLTRLAQVFSNLLINAAKYTRGHGRIGLSVERQGGDAVVSVSDTGIGIAAEQMARIFEMFGQVDAAPDRPQSGLGIGLSLARALVELHGGTITARSDGLGAGSTFVVRLPLARAVRGHEAATRSDDATANAAEAGAGRCRVLIADDLREIADSLATLLEVMGHTVKVAYDGAQALQVAEDFRPDVVLLDLGMPRLDGYETCRRIREQPWARDVTLIAQTGWGQEEDRRRTRAAGFDHHVVKPVDPNALLALFPHCA